MVNKKGLTSYTPKYNFYDQQMQRIGNNLRPIQECQQHWLHSIVYIELKSFSNYFTSFLLYIHIMCKNKFYTHENSDL